MKIYRLPKLIEGGGEGEYRMDPPESAQGSLYLVYGRLAPDEKDRTVAAPCEDEAVFCLIKGAISVNSGTGNKFPLAEGEAFHVSPGCALVLENPGNHEALYIVTGARASNVPAKDDPAKQDPQDHENPGNPYPRP